MRLLLLDVNLTTFQCTMILQNKQDTSLFQCFILSSIPRCRISEALIASERVVNMILLPCSPVGEAVFLLADPNLIPFIIVSEDSICNPWPSTSHPWPSTSHWLESKYVIWIRTAVKTVIAMIAVVCSSNSTNYTNKQTNTRGLHHFIILAALRMPASPRAPSHVTANRISQGVFLSAPNSSENLPSLKLTKTLKIGHPKRKFIFQPSIFRCYVSFKAGTPQKTRKDLVFSNRTCCKT